MGPPSYMRSVVDRNVVMRRIPVAGRVCNRSSTHAVQNTKTRGPTGIEHWLLGQLILVSFKVS